MNAAAGKTIVIIAQDLRTCYEYIKFNILALKGIQHQFPLKLLRLTLVSYGWMRFLTTGRTVAAGIQACQGMIAGCVAATRELKAYMKDAITNVIIRNPEADIEAWIDDLTIEAANSDGDTVATIAKKGSSRSQKINAR